MSASSIHGATEDLIRSYQELNGSVEVFEGRALPADIQRHMRLNRPFVVKGGCASWRSMRWNTRYLRETMGDRLVKIAETPFGNADSPVLGEDGLRLFVKPSERDIPFVDFLQALLAISSPDGSRGPDTVIYSQAQNDNLRSEYLPLYGDVPEDIPEMTTALGRKPDAINLWLGTDASTTSLHRDNYENVYAQICGAKTFVLIPPVNAACVNERFLPCATYCQADNWDVVPDDPEVKVPVALWDPDNPEENSTAFSAQCDPLRITLNPGDLLYLPACWYHKVTQKNSEEGFCCSVNYWYDMDFDGSFYSSASFVRQMAWAIAGEA